MKTTIVCGVKKSRKNAKPFYVVGKHMVILTTKERLLVQEALGLFTSCGNTSKTAESVVEKFSKAKKV
jgi:hypothetical protein